MSVAVDDARAEAEIALYKAITKKVGEALEGPQSNQVSRLKELAGAYASVAFGSR